MTYLLSLLTDQSSVHGATQFLCYYINDTSELQTIRVMNGVRCEFDRVVFSRERLLFTALPDSYLEIHSCSTGLAQSGIIACNSLRIHEQPDLESNLNIPDSRSAVDSSIDRGMAAAGL